MRGSGRFFLCLLTSGCLAVAVLLVRKWASSRHPLPSSAAVLGPSAWLEIERCARDKVACPACTHTNLRSQWDKERYLLPLVILATGGQPGTFVELGALDGLTFSNTLVLERCYGWRGLLIEANPANYEKLRRSGRKAHHAHAAVCKAGRHNVSRTVDVPCRTLRSLLSAARLPRADFLSLDVEGAEEIVLRHAEPWQFRVVLVEWDGEDAQKEARVHALLQAAGLVLTYELRLGPQKNGGWSRVYVVSTLAAALVGGDGARSLTLSSPRLAAAALRAVANHSSKPAALAPPAGDPVGRTIAQQAAAAWAATAGGEPYRGLPVVRVYLICFNERTLLPHAVAHYRHLMPGCTITIVDNESTDGSAAAARELGCRVISFSTRSTSMPAGAQNEARLAEMRNSVWQWDGDESGRKSIWRRNEWVIVADLDEWLVVTASALAAEESAGTTVLTTQGFQMVGDSQRTDLSDINVHAVDMGVPWSAETKQLCFRVPHIRTMQFTLGSHASFPIGLVRKSSATYAIKHMPFPGLPFAVARQRRGHARSDAKFYKAHKPEQWDHYTGNATKVAAYYQELRAHPLLVSVKATMPHAVPQKKQALDLYTPLCSPHQWKATGYCMAEDPPPQTTTPQPPAQK